MLELRDARSMVMICDDHANKCKQHSKALCFETQSEHLQLWQKLVRLVMLRTAAQWQIPTLCTKAAAI